MIRNIPPRLQLVGVTPTRCYSAQTAHTTRRNPGSYGPSVRLLLTQYNLVENQVPASGPHSRLLKGDVLGYIQSNKLAPAAQPSPTKPPTIQTPAIQAPAVNAAKPKPAVKSTPIPMAAIPSANYRDLDLSSMRKTIAKRLTLSKTTIPHIYASANCEIGQLISVRKQMIEQGTKVSVNDFIVKACAAALKAMPAVNVIWNGQDAQPLESVDISVAVATDSGLITPIITSADKRSLADISGTTKELAMRARQGLLQPHEFQGGSFTISNLGMFGIKEFSAVINPPQACILAVGGTQLLPGPAGKPIATMSITASCDARMIDSITATEFVSRVREFLESPGSLAL